MRGSSRRSRIKRSVSERQMGELLAEPSNVDILTKVAQHFVLTWFEAIMPQSLQRINFDQIAKVPIPRSKSFMTVPQNYSIAELFEELQVISFYWILFDSIEFRWVDGIQRMF